MIRPSDYQYIVANTAILKIASHVVNRSLVGLPLCRNDEWFQTTLGYATDAFTISAKLRPRSRLLRPFVYMFLGARRRIYHHLKRADVLLATIIKQRTPGDTKHADVLQWMIDGAKGRDKSTQELAHKTLFLNLASVMSSTMGIVHAIVSDTLHAPQ